MTPEQLEERLIQFAVSILRLVRQMPLTPDAKHLGGQLMRSGTSPGLHYGEVRAAESDADFRHKLKVVNKELRETKNCLRIISLMDGVYTDSVQVAPILSEANELVAIFTATIKKLDQRK